MKYLIFISLVFIGCSKPDSQELLRICGSNQCCLDSYALMKEKDYFLAADNLCPEGKKLNSLDCAGSLRWCE